MREMRRLAPYVLSQLHVLVLSLFFLILSGVLEAVNVMLLEPIFNQWAGPAGADLPVSKFPFLQEWLGLAGAGLSRIAFFLVLFALLKGVFLFLAEYGMSYVGQSVVAALRKRLNARLLEQSLNFFTRHATGQLMARIITDTERIQQGVSRTLADFLRQAILLCFFLALLFYIDWRLAFLSLLVAPLVLWVTLRLGRRVRKVSASSQASLAGMSELLQETISGQRIVKAFCMEDYERKRFDRLTEQQRRLNLKLAKTSALGSPVVEVIGYLAFAPFLLYADYQMNRGLSIGAFVTFVVTLLRLYEPVRKLSRMHLLFQQTFASSQRIFELLETPREVKEAPRPLTLPPFRDQIEFRNVSFSYDRAELPVLKDLCVTIRRGEIVALVGPSGAGKSTMVSLIPRFYDVTEGAILIDGVDIRQVSLKSLRQQIAIVTQDTFLFNDTVRANIAYGQEECPLERIQEAARAALIHDFIMGLPRGYNTVIGERGEKLSGGQRQRLAIARALLKDAPILILDEATSALDSESEALVQEALQNLIRHRTTLVIAHRLSTVRTAHRILVLDQGQIVESGDHESLLNRSGLYRRLYDLQFAEVNQPLA